MFSKTRVVVKGVSHLFRLGAHQPKAARVVAKRNGEDALMLGAVQW